MVVNVESSPNSPEMVRDLLESATIQHVVREGGCEPAEEPESSLCRACESMVSESENDQLNQGEFARNNGFIEYHHSWEMTENSCGEGEDFHCASDYVVDVVAAFHRILMRT